MFVHIWKTWMGNNVSHKYMFRSLLTFEKYGLVSRNFGKQRFHQEINCNTLKFYKIFNLQNSLKRNYSTVCSAILAIISKFFLALWFWTRRLRLFLLESSLVSRISVTESIGKGKVHPWSLASLKGKVEVILIQRNIVQKEKLL